MDLFEDFHKGTLDISRLNFAILTLVPKEQDASAMKKFRPISLLNCSFKIFTKVLTNRLSLILHRLIATNQSAFIKGRYILESVVTAHEVLHSVHASKEKGLVLKLDYEKAFDKVDLAFLEELLRIRGFGPHLISMIMKIVHDGSVGVRINQTDGPFFKTGKGLRQGDPLSPLLFNLVVDVVTKMLAKAARLGLIQGLCPDALPGGVICLQYADDTILFIQNDLAKANNLKIVLSCFEQVSGMKINYTKSELIPIGMEAEEFSPFATILGCSVGSFPIKYLGIPLHHDKLRREDVQPLVDKILKRMAGWRGKLLSYAGRILLIKTCLASIPIYLLSFFKFPKWALDLINTQMAHCLWSDFEGNRKLHLAKWDLVCMKKEFGGLGIPNLKEVNLCLLGSWLKRYISDDGKIWKTIIDHKYRTNSPNIFACNSQHASRFWKGVMEVVKAIKFGYRWIVGDGKKIRFWEDTWFGTSPLATQFWEIYTLCNEQNTTISDAWDGTNLKFTFRRNFSDNMMRHWHDLLEIACSISLSSEMDSLVRQLENKGVYSTSSLYHVINFRGVSPVYIPALWKLAVPPRVHIFLWLVSHNKIMTRDNLRKRQILKPEECSFCLEKESVNHLLFECIVAKNIWAVISDFFAVTIGDSFESVARFWVSNTKNAALNSICAAVMWSIWKFRNDLTFNGVVWLNTKQVLRRILLVVQSWKIIFRDRSLPQIEAFCQKISQLLREPLQLMSG